MCQDLGPNAGLQSLSIAANLILIGGKTEYRRAVVLIKFRDLEIPETLDELVDPSHTALLVIDVQNDFCDPLGVWNKKDVYASTYKNTIANISRVITTARHVGVLIIYTQVTQLPNHANDSAASLRARMRILGVDEPSYVPSYCVEGSWGQKFVEAIAPREGDLIVRKQRISAFEHTDLDLILRCRGIKTVIITGVLTEVCVETTARHAQSKDYFVVILTDCVDSPHRRFHENSLEFMRSMFTSTDSANIISVLRSVEI